MEVLKALEEKIVSLIDLTKELKAENVHLIEENTQLQMKLKSLEGLLSDDTQRIEELHQEKTITKAVVDELIKSIDSLVKAELR